MRKQLGAILKKVGIKKQIVKFDLFICAKYREIKKKVRLIIIPYLVKRRSISGYYAIDFDTDWNGFGSRVIKTLEILLYCDINGLVPVIKYNYQEEVKPPIDYFKEIFHYKTPLNIDEKKLRYTKIRDNDELWKEDYNQKLKLSFAKSLFDKYLGINQNIMEEVELFEKQWFNNKKILGVHYRGTDKAGEALIVSKEKLLQNITEILNKNGDFKIIFLSTDDQKIIDFLKTSSLGLPLVYREDTIRSNNGEQFHRRKENSKTLVNRDAIVNCLLLSRCHFLLKTASILSDCSVVFNPLIKVQVISFPYSNNLTWWPATEINLYQIIK